MKESWIVEDLPVTNETKTNADAQQSTKRKRQRKSKKSANSRQVSQDVHDINQELGLREDWPWKPIAFPSNAPFTEEAAGGFLELEEIDDVQVDYKFLADGRKIAQFKKLENVKEKPAPVAQQPKKKNTASKVKVDLVRTAKDLPENESADDEDAAAAEAMRAFDEQMMATTQPPAKKMKTQAQEQKVQSNFDPKVDMSAWSKFKLKKHIIGSLARAGFTQPTAIQKQALPEAISKRRDIIGAAETGSGKTLAFGLPIINRLLAPKVDSNGLKALILTPTRELAIQVRDHLAKIVDGTDIEIVAIIGGMSLDKQKRLLSHNPQVIIATPGRFWEVLAENHHDGYLDNMNESLEFLVLDEADRMVENGHFKELDSILKMIQQTGVKNEWPSEESERNSDTEGNSEGEEEEKITQRQVFVFSATLPGLTKTQEVSGKKKTASEGKECLSGLMEKIVFQNDDPCIIDLTSEQMLAHGLTERKIDCVQKDKDLYLYYFLLRYPGRTIVFVNSIDTIRRLVPLFNTVQLPVWGLHAQMQQRQRLKNLDRFRSNQRGILIASDVAARGLDIPNVDHVIHYQIPRSPELYVHRSGRTARANKNGLTVLFNSAEEQKSYRMLCKLLKKPEGLEDFPIDDLLLLKPLKERLQLAAEIERAQHQHRKAGSDDRWLKDTAEAMDIEIDDQFIRSSDSEDETAMHQRRQQNKDANRLSQAKSQLAALLAKPLLPAGVSARYLTSNAQAGLIVDTLLRNAQLNGTDGENMTPATCNQLPASKPTSALDAACRSRNSRKRSSQRKQ